MTKNTRLLYFSFVFNDLIVRENDRDSVRGGFQAGLAAAFTTLFSNKRPDTEIP